MTATMYYDNDADPAALAGQTVAIIGYGSQGHAHALNLHESGRRRRRRARARRRRAGRSPRTPGLRVTDVAEAVQAADVIMILVPDTAQKAVYDAEIAPNLRPGHLLMFAHGFNIHFGRIDPPGIVDVGMVAPEGPGPPASARVYQAGGGVPALFAVHRDAVGHRPRPRPRLRPGARLHPGRRPRDDVRRGDRDRPVRRAGRPLRRHRGARQDGLRDARRGRLPARARLLRDDARAQAHRRPDVPRRPQLHALQRQRHRRVRRLRRRARGSSTTTSGRRCRQVLARDPGRHVRRPLDRRERVRPPGVRAAARGRPRPPDRAGRRASCAPRCRSSTRSRSWPARPRRRPRRPGPPDERARTPARRAVRRRRAASASSTPPCATASRRPAPA